jgi:FkbM family methyltransferase
MIRWLHAKMTSNRITRPLQRRIVRRVKGLVGCPDAYDDLAAICRKVRPAAVLDIGSHHGVTVSRLLDDLPQQTIHAFEPTPETFNVLRQRVARFPNVTLHQLAVSDRTGTLTFHVNEFDQTNSLLENARPDENPFADLQRHVRAVEVASTTLDDWAAKFAPAGSLVIKSDIQGAEGMLIKGGQKTMAERVVAFYGEVCLLPLYEHQTTFSELDGLMKHLGFTLFNIYPCGKDSLGRAAWTDALWVKQAILPV